MYTINSDYGIEANTAIITNPWGIFPFQKRLHSAEFTIEQAGTAIAPLPSSFHPGMFTTSSDFAHKMRNLIRGIRQFFHLFSQQSSQDTPLRGLIKASCFTFSGSSIPESHFTDKREK